LLNSIDNSITFGYRPEGLDEGSRSLVVEDVRIADGAFHHVGVSVFGDSFALFINGRLVGLRQRLIGPLEDGPGRVMIGQKLNNELRFQGGYKLKQ